MKDFDYPKVNWELCSNLSHRIMIGGLCIHHGLFAAWKKCLAPGIKPNSICIPIGQYSKEYRKLKKRLKK